jgi:hypothetical protein
MRKRIVLPILIISIIIQLLVPVGMIAYGNNADDDLQKYGKEYKFRIAVYSIYSGDVDYSLQGLAELYQEGKYGVISEDEEGYAVITEIKSTRPEEPNYIRVNRETRTRLDEFSVVTGRGYIGVQEQSAYLLVRIYKGNLEIVEMYIDDITAQEWVLQYEQPTEDVILF